VGREGGLPGGFPLGHLYIELFGLDDSGAVWRYARDKDLWIRMSMKYEQEFGAPLREKLA
jgi:hypothetical protein